MNEGDLFLVADVGATKTLVFLAKHNKDKPELLKKEEFLAKEHSSVESIISIFLEKEGGVVKHAIIGACGIVQNNCCKLTNLPWIIKIKEVEKTCSIENVILINDLALEGSGVLFLSEEDVVVLQKGRQTNSNMRTILSVGTGLGEGIIFKEEAIATEGGHADFAAETEKEIEFFLFMKERYGHVSFERVLSGEGIINIYEFLSKRRNLTPEEIFSSEESLCKEAVTFFLKTLGKEAGNMALKSLSLGGVFLSGGMLKKNSLLIQREDVIGSFSDKGRFKSLLEEVPVYLIKGDKGIFYGGWRKLAEQNIQQHSPT